MCTIADDCARVAERGLEPPFESPPFSIEIQESKNFGGDKLLGPKESPRLFPEIAIAIADQSRRLVHSAPHPIDLIYFLCIFSRKSGFTKNRVFWGVLPFPHIS